MVRKFKKMILNFTNLFYKYKLKINGVIHIGAHLGEEYELYKSYNIPNIAMVEPQPHIFSYLKNNVGSEVKLFNVALGPTNGKVKMNVALGAGSSSSILRPKVHLTQHPDVIFGDTPIEVDMMKLDELQINKQNYNFINIDVQGFELEVFKGGIETLKNIDFIISEVNRDELYENCAKVEELDDFLRQFNFKRVETSWDGVTWGDAFYVNMDYYNK